MKGFAMSDILRLAWRMLVGIFLLGESASLLRLCSIGLILAGVAGLKLSA